MYQLDNKGYQPSTPEEILEEIKAEVQQNIPSFIDFPPELRGNLLYEGVVFEVYLENLLTAMFNFSSPSLANETFFEFWANERGLRRKGAYRSEVDLKFTGAVGSLIPQGLEVTNQAGTITFKVYEETFIGTTGEVTVLAYSDDTDTSSIGIGDLNKLVLNVDLQVENTSAPTQPQEEEDFDEFKKACQARWRNPKGMSYEGLLTALSRIEGVDDRTINYALKDIEDSGKTYECINLVVGGGDTLEIAQTIYKYGGLTAKKYLSQPSNSETSRTVGQELIIYGNSHIYKFTRPKLINLGIKVQISFVKIDASSEAIKELTKEAMTNYINSLQVGAPINKTSLLSVFLEGALRAGIKPENIKDGTDFTANDGGSPLIFNDGFLPIEFDQYCILAEYDVEINQ